MSPARLPEPSGKLQRRQRTLDVINFKLLEVQTEKTQFEQKLKNKFKKPQTPSNIPERGDKYFRRRKQEELNSEGCGEKKKKKNTTKQQTQRNKPNQPRRTAYSNSSGTLTV